jgi:cell division protease FtsH
MEGYNTARSVLEEHSDALTRLAEALLEREVLDAREIGALVKGEELPARTTPPPPSEAPESAAPADEPTEQPDEAGERPSTLPEPGSQPA